MQSAISLFVVGLVFTLIFFLVIGSIVKFGLYVKQVFSSTIVETETDDLSREPFKDYTL